MRIVHLADTHLGYSAYRKITDEGVNQREMDVYDAFTQCIDYILKTKPDLVLHAGDLFDSVRPTNRAITVAFQQILRLSKQHIPFIVISGNHETPKLKETGNIFRIFEHITDLHPVHNNHYEKISLDLKGKTVTVHAIPQCENPLEFEENLRKVKTDRNADFNILLAHGAVVGIGEFKMNEFNELFIPVKALHDDFDYIALGHYHKHTKLQDNAFYAGSTERFSFSEATHQKGFLDVTFGKKLMPRFVPLQTRVMVDVPPLDCSTLRADEIIKKIKEMVVCIHPDRKILRLQLHNIPQHIQRSIDIHQIQDIVKNAIHFEIKSTTIKPQGSSLSESIKMKSLADEFQRFFSTQQFSDKDVLLKLGLQYINTIEEKDERP